MTRSLSASNTQATLACIFAKDSRYLVNRNMKDSVKNCYSHNYWLTPWSRFLLEKLTGFQLDKKFPTFYGTRGFINAFTSARHLSLSWVSSIQSIIPNPTSWRFILILSSHLRLGLQSGLFFLNLFSMCTTRASPAGISRDIYRGFFTVLGTTLYSWSICCLCWIRSYYYGVWSLSDCSCSMW